jgi:sensor histidine kinase YesM
MKLNGINKLKKDAEQSGLKRLVYKYSLILFAIMIFVNSINFIFQDLSNGYHINVAQVILAEIIAFCLFYSVLPMIYYVIIKFPVAKPNILINLLIQFVATALLTLLLTVMMYYARSLVWLLLGYGKYDYGIFGYRILMEYSRLTLLYAILYGGIYGLKNALEKQEQELKSVKLEEQLAMSKVEALQMQLNPHFLFNTLNLISSTMYADVKSADKMIADLSDLLRMTLNKKGEQVHFLIKEIEMLNLYADIMKQRFRDKLIFEVHYSESESRCLVPVFLLQPLVENSIRHSTESLDPISICVKIFKEGEKLILLVSDTGPGLNENFEYDTDKGIGLSNTSSRLDTLYGGNNAFTFGNKNDKGFEVKIVIPYKEG